MNEKYNNLTIAAHYNLWQKFVDPGAFGTKEEFDNMTIPERLDFMKKCGIDVDTTEYAEYEKHSAYYNARH